MPCSRAALWDPNLALPPEEKWNDCRTCLRYSGGGLGGRVIDCDLLSLAGVHRAGEVNSCCVCPAPAHTPQGVSSSALAARESRHPGAEAMSHTTVSPNIQSRAVVYPTERKEDHTANTCSSPSGSTIITQCAFAAAAAADESDGGTAREPYHCNPRLEERVRALQSSSGGDSKLHWLLYVPIGAPPQ